MFKQGVVDPSNRLSSWSPLQDCCLYWEGVWCDDDRVVGLHLESYSNSETLRGEINFSSLLSLDFLEWLYLKYNDFERISMPSINNSVATHPHLRPNSSKLWELNLSYNTHLRIDNLHYLLSRLPSLTSLDLSGIHLPSATNWVQLLASLPLKELYLNECNLTSSVLSLEYANFSSLSILDLGLNDFTFGLPNWLFNLSKHLSYIGLSQCNFRGQLSDFSDFRHLHSLDLSNNKLKESIPDWIGQLDSLAVLDLSHNMFHGSFPSNLMNSSSLKYLDLSFNDLSGTLPKVLGPNESDGSIYVSEIFMSFNKFKGQLPRVSPTVHVLDLANNSFSGPLSSSLCHRSETYDYENPLGYLDLSNNYLTQELPDWLSNCTHLTDIFLGNNQLVGQVPLAMGSSLQYLRALDLQNNGFSGDIPWTFSKRASLVLINLEGNNFSGSIQTWMPQNVSVVKLRSNQFTGTIPPQLCTLPNLIVLDLANNKLSGSIPHCLSNITSFSSALDESYLLLDNHMFLLGYMKTDLHTKGQQLEYQKNLSLVRSIDLSANKLSGEISIQLFKLTMLKSLNLSNNHLIGEIPEQIGELKDLESLDFSHNHLHGNIPQSMCSLSFLSVLNLSDNNFSGQIPLGTQLQGFDAWSYTGNLELCVPPLQKNCTIPEKPNNREQVEGIDDDAFLKSLYLGMGVGFAVGFWVVCGSLFLNRAWRHAYFRFFDGMVDQIDVIVAIKLGRFHCMGICYCCRSVTKFSCLFKFKVTSHNNFYFYKHSSVLEWFQFSVSCILNEMHNAS
ncbi:hypothetical protein K1719_027517 [Acacia pycnantha]|nr:hypothetical protein K1719_027517 [Acacia pycnantha]